MMMREWAHRVRQWTENAGAAISRERTGLLLGVICGRCECPTQWKTSAYCRPRNRQTKEAFLSAIKNCNSSANEANRLTTASIGLPGTTQRIFITDHLSPRNKRLLGLVKEAAREKQYAYVWVKNSKLLHTD